METEQEHLVRIREDEENWSRQREAFEARVREAAMRSGNLNPTIQPRIVEEPDEPRSYIYSLPHSIWNDVARMGGTSLGREGSPAPYYVIVRQFPSGDRDYFTGYDSKNTELWTASYDCALRID